MMSNSNSMMAAAMMRLSEMTGDMQYATVGHRVVNSILSAAGPIRCAANVTNANHTAECLLFDVKFLVELHEFIPALYW